MYSLFVLAHSRRVHRSTTRSSTRFLARMGDPAGRSHGAVGRPPHNRVRFLARMGDPAGRSHGAVGRPPHNRGWETLRVGHMGRSGDRPITGSHGAVGRPPHNRAREFSPSCGRQCEQRVRERLKSVCSHACRQGAEFTVVAAPNHAEQSPCACTANCHCDFLQPTPAVGTLRHQWVAGVELPLPQVDQIHVRQRARSIGPHQQTVLDVDLPVAIEVVLEVDRRRVERRA